MKSPPSVMAEDDIFGPPRTYPSGYNPPKTRITMISAKYRQKEERRKVLKISINKLKKIEDPESSLCRSVLINNTMKRLQQETRDEKIQKQQLNYNENYLSLKDEKNANFDDLQPFPSAEGRVRLESFVVETDFDTKLAQEINEVNAKDIEALGSLVEENLNGLTTNYSSENLGTTSENNDRFPSRKRSYDEIDDCDVHDVLSQFYMPPTPRMLTCIDEDEDVNIIDVETLPKRLRVEAPSNEASNNCNILEEERSICDKAVTDFSVNNFLNNNIPAQDSRLRYLNTNQTMETETNSFGCGHASMFNDLQSNVYQLVTSLET
ncbi:hypothetical protein NQ317_012718 [Molorchus minor]|uniref:SERTA domain-containing protein n=1 Tax=Molorchus minor TaxID=1323400 RepID=A0ABQ9IZ18_9CUCU|nr:hypothetical protein NQ317_012718 [Molorchus minor]